ncbi:MAG: DUF4296 domain-containing protein [Flavobacteriaceae bacterium]|nr:DUF4296 domain-containing protein [Flavobacteriaceae bacterium]MCB0474878.1 DUF4296 domain-containing protein [Flavobacteriaceae bacterium]
MKKWIFIAIVGFLVSCTSRTIYKKPEKLISKEKMIDLWTDIYIARSAKSQKTISLQRDIDYLPSVFKKYGVDSAQFNASNIYYTSRIDEYEEMFKKVNDRLEQLKKKYRPESERDSLIRTSRERSEKEENYE